MNLLALQFLELSGYCVNAVRLHVNAADVLVTRGIDGNGSRYDADMGASVGRALE